MLRVSTITWLFLLLAQPALAGDGLVALPPVSDPAGSSAPAVFAGAPPHGKLTISGAEMLRQGHEYRQEIQAIIVQIQGQAEQAKGDKDVIKLNCILDKQTQVGVNAKIMDQALQRLQEAVSRRDEGAQLHEYARVTIIHQKAQVLRTEADACIGQEANYVGPTKLKVEVPQGISDDPDQPSPLSPTDPGGTRPTVASPYY